MNISTRWTTQWLQSGQLGHCNSKILWHGSLKIFIKCSEWFCNKYGGLFAVKFRKFVNEASWIQFPIFLGWTSKVVRRPNWFASVLVKSNGADKPTFHTSAVIFAIRSCDGSPIETMIALSTKTIIICLCEGKSTDLTDSCLVELSKTPWSMI